MITNKKRKIIFISVIVIIFTGLFVYLYLSQIKNNKQTETTPTIEQLKVIDSNPPNNSLGVSVFDPIFITFNQPVGDVSVTINSSPSEDWTYSQISPNVVKINHKLYLRVATTYNLSVFVHGNLIENLIFETAHEQNDPRELQIINDSQNKDYPLLSLTPYVTANYKVFYVAPLTLEVDVLNANFILQQDIISQIKSWVKSNQVDPETHKYNVVKIQSKN